MEVLYENITRNQGRERNMDLGLKGRKAIITGGSKGIGRAIANLLADEGCNVGICGAQGKRC
jgi:NADP-dependent 3-hydroxy acid dehydrogenase YdfG